MGEATGLTVHVGKALDVLRKMPDESVHNVITDPPYGLANTTPAQVLDCLTHWVGGDREYVPSGRGFMGHEWDAFVPPPALWDECMRVLKPGGHLLAFAGSRTVDLMGLSIRLAGFDIRDSITWLYGSGFPKSMDVSKVIDKTDAAQERRARALEFTAWIRAAGLTAQQIDAITGTRMGGHYVTAESQPAVATKDLFDMLRPLLPEVPERIEALVKQRTVESANYAARTVTQTATADLRPGDAITFDQRSSIERERRDIAHTDEAQRWAGWGTALKPASEPIVVARKPFAKGATVAANVLEHGTGALNIHACRVTTSANDAKAMERANSPGSGRFKANRSEPGAMGRSKAGDALDTTQGRWPANVVLTHSSECVKTGTHADRTETVAAWECAEGRIDLVERFTLPDGTSIEPTTSAVPMLLAVVQATRDLLPRATHNADTGNTRESAQVHVPPLSAQASSQGGCLDGSRFDGGHLHSEADDDRCSPQQLTDALEYVLALGRSLGRTPVNQCGAHPTSSGAVPVSSTDVRMAPGRIAVVDLSDPSASAETASNTGGTESPVLPLDGLGCSTPLSNTHECACSSAPSASRTVCIDERFRLQASSALRVASSLGVVACTDYTVEVQGCPVAELDAQSGVTASGGRAWAQGDTDTASWRTLEGRTGPAVRNDYQRGPDSGGASRFFPVFQYQAKAPTRERPSYIADDGTKMAHSTVKPLALMQHLVRLLAAPGTVILDPFVGSGTTAEACALEGVECIAVESHLPYLPLIDQRAERVGATVEWIGRPEPVDQQDPDAERQGLLTRLGEGLVERALTLPSTLLERVQACGGAEAARELWQAHRDEWTAEHTAAAKALAA